MPLVRRAEVEKIEANRLFQFVDELIGQKDSRNVRFHALNVGRRLGISSWRSKKPTEPVIVVGRMSIDRSHATYSTASRRSTRIPNQIAHLGIPQCIL